MKGSAIERIERLNLYIGGALVLGTLLVGGTKSQVLGMCVGVALTCINFWVLRKLVYRWTADAAAGRQSRAMFLMAPKMLLLMTAVVLALAFLPISVVTFTIGYSVFVVSILVDTVYAQIAPPVEEPPVETPADPTSESNES